MLSLFSISFQRSVHVPMRFVPRFVKILAEYPIRYGLPLLRLLAPPCKGPSERGFYQPVESPPCILQPIAMFTTPLWRRALHPTTSQRPVMPTSHAPLLPSNLFLSSSLTSLHSKNFLPRILRATSPPSLKKASNSTMSSSEGSIKKQLFQTSSRLTFSPGFFLFAYYRELLQYQQLLRNQIS